MSAPVAGAEGPSLAERLCEARVELRPELEVSRHLFRGTPSYVVHDPITFQSSRFSGADYRVLTHLRARESLGEIFESLVHEGALGREEEEDFYTFVFRMHRQGLLKLPIADDKVLYKRHAARSRAQRSQWVSAILFRRIPVWNPDRFLDRTMRFVAPFLGRTALASWVLLVGLAAWVLERRWDDFRAPVGDIFSGANLVYLWVSLIGLKVLHEFGHAYICRFFGGHVPEMGVFLILFTPCAYVDATSSWSFSRKRDRIFVCLGGMYVELAIAALCVLLWAVQPPGLVRSLLHNVVTLASITTVAFNVNPLMRYDGYYALCDLLETPNLRGKATARALRLLKRVFLGLGGPKCPEAPGYRAFLIAFGFAAGVYKIFLVLGIATVIAMKFFLLGMGLALVYAIGEIVRVCRRAVPYLWTDAETQPVRRRARVCAVALFGGLPLVVAGVPLPARVSAPGVVGSEEQHVVRAEVSGFLASLHVEAGRRLPMGSPIATLEQAQTRTIREQANSRLEASRIRWKAAEGSDPSLALERRERVQQLEREAAHSQRDFDRLEVRAPVEGMVLEIAGEEQLGRFVEVGEELATIARGRAVVRALLDAEALAAVEPRIGDAVEFRSVDRPEELVRGTVLRVNPHGSREPDAALVEHLDRVRLAVDPLTGRTGSAQFELIVAIEDEQLRPATSGWVRFSARPETLARKLLRKGILLLDQIRG